MGIEVLFGHEAGSSAVLAPLMAWFIYVGSMKILKTGNLWELMVGLLKKYYHIFGN
jgi:hypothetical protein